MGNSTYVKTVLRSNKTIAIALDKGLVAFRRGMKKSLNQISLGAERASWYTSCFFDERQDVCGELRHEDYRMWVCIKEFFTRSDPLADILLICVRHVLNFYNKEERVRILAMVYDVYGVAHGDEQINDELNSCNDFLMIQTDSPESRQALEGVARMCELSFVDIITEPLLDTENILNPAKITTDIVTRKTVAYAFAKAAAESISLTLVVRRKVNNYAVRAATGLFYYGIEQEASMAVRKLKRLNSDYYQILYNNNLEMFFFLIEPYLPAEIYYPSLLKSNEDAAVSFLKGLLK
ncbi:hypothetical protein K5O51_002465 [Salmonella enterica subsp. enterica]|nr:hypothetical protein [Salmonella enterica subsp. enterica]